VGIPERPQEFRKSFAKMRQAPYGSLCLVGYGVRPRKKEASMDRTPKKTLTGGVEYQVIE
jgi:hypothetical protein